MNSLRCVLKLPSIKQGQIRNLSMNSEFRKRAVVSSFICTSPQSSTGLTFALFKRSQNVGTYRGKWAVCSGSIETTDQSPQEAAQREILEETTLSDQDISLLRRGKPFSLTDEALKTEWTINPFAWQLKDGAKKITFDWEHTEYRFIKPEDVENYEHVPQLEVGMTRVMVDSQTEKSLAMLRDDHESGASALAIKALEALLQAVRGEALTRFEVEEFWRELRMIGWHLSNNGRPSMAAAIESGILKALDGVWQDGISISNLKAACEASIKKQISARSHSLERLADHFLDTISPKPRMKIVTLSSSGTITKCLETFIRKYSGMEMLTISLLESRPNFEGAGFVRALLAKLPNVSKRVQFEILSDASAATAVEGADLVIIGGDRVLGNGDVSNKIGSRVLSVVAKEANPHCKVVAVFETDKISGTASNEELNDETEITDAWPTSVLVGLRSSREAGYSIKVKNVYFEWVPAKYIDTYITEAGPLDQGQIEDAVRKGKALEGRVFGNL